MADLPEKLLPLVVLNILMPTTCCGKNMVKTERSIENKYLYLLSLWYNESPHYGGSRMVVVPYLPSLWYNSPRPLPAVPEVVAPYLLSLWYNVAALVLGIAVVVAPYLLSLWYNGFEQLIEDGES